MNRFFASILLLQSISLLGQTPLFQTGNSTIKSLAVSPDGKSIAVEETSSEIAIWNIATRKKTMILKRDKLVRKADQGEMPEVLLGLSGCSFFDKNNQFLFVKNPYELTVWSTKKIDPVLTLFSRPDFYDISSDNLWVSVVKSAIAEDTPGLSPASIRDQWRHKTDTIIIYSLIEEKTDTLLVEGSENKKLRFLPNRKHLLFLGDAGDVIIYDFEYKKIINRYNVFNTDYQGGGSGEFGSSTSITTHHKLPFLALRNTEGDIIIYDIEQYKIIQEIPIKSKTVEGAWVSFNDFHFTPNGKYLMWSTIEIVDDRFRKYINYWDITKGEIVKSFGLESFRFNINYSSDGKYFAISSGFSLDKSGRFLSVYDGNSFNLVFSTNDQGPVSFFPNDSNRFAFFINGGIGTYKIEK